jgi:ATP-dependent protease ClpP protease subunit
VSERALRIAALAAIPRPGAQLPRPAQSDTRTRVEASARSAEVFLYGVVGWDIWVEELVPELAALDVDEITCHVNSPGGDAFDGIALANTLVAHKAKVTMHIEGMAASAASVIAMAGDEIVAHPGSRFMAHDALCLSMGNAADHRADADLLDAVSQDIAGIYAARAGGTPDEWRQKMLATTWFSADEAVAAGLADRVAGREQPGQDEAPALTPAAHGWTDLVAQWRADTPDAARPAAPLAATCCTGPCQHLPADEPALHTSAPVADAPPAPEPQTAAVNLSELICSAIREAVTS